MFEIYESTSLYVQCSSRTKHAAPSRLMRKSIKVPAYDHTVNDGTCLCIRCRIQLLWAEMLLTGLRFTPARSEMKADSKIRFIPESCYYVHVVQFP